MALLDFQGPADLAGRQRLKRVLRVIADLPDLNLGLALACPSIRTEGDESAGVNVLLATNVLPETIKWLMACLSSQPARRPN